MECINVICLKNNKKIDGKLELIEGDNIEIKLLLAGTEYVTNADNYFEGLIDIRKKLENENIKLLCKGCCLDVYPSGMMLNMGAGRKAYRLHLGKQASMDELVDIFSLCREEDVVSIEAQEVFFTKWINSLG